MQGIRQLVLVLGDQLDAQSAAFDGFDLAQDVVWMAEVAEESTHAPSHKARTVMFLSAMRHFAGRLREQKYNVCYSRIDHSENTQTFAGELRRAVVRLHPRRLVVVHPGEWRVSELLRETAEELSIHLEIRPDRHFFCSPEEFTEWAGKHKQLRMEYFYREQRRKHGILMDGKEPSGGRWNFDAENRGSFGKQGPLMKTEPVRFPPDEITREVMQEVNRRFAKNPGSCDRFDFPVTASQANEALEDFIENRLAQFGLFQDAMWTDEPILYHARLSAAMNLKLLNPRTSIQAAEKAFRQKRAPLEAVEGFIRQILGWREYVHGVYWAYMPEYLERNALKAAHPLPDLYWSGQTQMNCLRQAVGQTLEFGYAHHIQRLMVNGLYALLLGVSPKEIHEWYLGIYVDAVEWVELPNVTGMSQFADGGLMGSKPYAATGKYISRMSNYCLGCRFDPKQSTSEEACPFTTLYWDFLMRHQKALAGNRRMELQLRNLVRLSSEKKKAIRRRAEYLKTNSI